MIDQTKKLVQALKSLQFPVAYYTFPENDAPKLPYIVYWQESDNTLFCDNAAYGYSGNYTLELYYDRKNPELENRIKKEVSDNGFIISRGADVYIPTEKMFMLTFDVSYKNVSIN